MMLTETDRQALTRYGWRPLPDDGLGGPPEWEHVDGWMATEGTLWMSSVLLDCHLRNLLEVVSPPVAWIARWLAKLLHGRMGA